jgi:flagellar assembly protein FliH
MGYLIRQPLIVTQPSPLEAQEITPEQEASAGNPVAAPRLAVSNGDTAFAEAVVQEAFSAEQIEAITEQARQEGQAQGYAAGYTTGLQQGEQAALAAWQAKQEQLAALLASISTARAHAVEHIDSEFVPVVFSALTKIVGELAFSADFVRAAVRQALQTVRNSEQIIIKAHPADVALLNAEGLLPHPARISIVADDTITAGCIIETDCGNVDAQLDSQLASLKALLVQLRVEPAMLKAH